MSTLSHHFIAKYFNKLYAANPDNVLITVYEFSKEDAILSHFDEHCGHCDHEPHSHEGLGPEATSSGVHIPHAHDGRHEHSHDHHEKPKWGSLLIRIVISLFIIFALPLILKQTLVNSLFNPELLFSIAAILIIGYPVIFEAFEGLFHKEPFNECMLMTIAATAACFIDAYHEAYFVMLLYSIGEFLQQLAVYRSRHSIDKLIALVPKEVDVLENDTVVRKHPDGIAVGDIVLVNPGVRVPVDGVIIEGEASFNTAALTGESLPRDLHQDDMVYGGYIPVDKPVKIQVVHEYNKSTIAHIQELIEGAEAKKANAEQFITKFSRIYTPVVVGIAFLIALVTGIMTGFSISLGWNNGLYTAVTFLVTSCPCALVLSIPLAFFAGIGCSSRHNILVKGAEYLETLSKTTVCAFDKTGTITTGQLSVGYIESRVSKQDLIDVAANAEKYSTHPIAEAITKLTYNDKIVTDVEELSGRGIVCRVEGDFCLVGNAKLMQQYNVQTEEYDGTVIYVARNQSLLGWITLTDTIKDGARTAIKQLKALGIKKTFMISGDTTFAAATIAGKAGIDKTYAEQEPEQKVHVMEEILKEGTTLYAGDGLNDAAVLTRADVGIAMGGIGSDVAVDAADIILMDDDLKKIPLAIRIARKTMRIVAQNITFAIVSKLVVLGLSALGLPNMMWMAVIADTGVALLCAANSLCALRIKE